MVNVYSLLLKMNIEIVDLPIKNSDFPQLYKRLPEGMLSLGYSLQIYFLGLFDHLGGNPHSIHGFIIIFSLK